MELFRLMAMPLQFHFYCRQRAMHLFKAVSQFYGLMGLNPPQSNQIRWFNLRISYLIFIAVASLISFSCHFILKPRTALERAESVYLILSGLACASIFFVCYEKIGEIYTFFENINEYIERSKL